MIRSVREAFAHYRLVAILRGLPPEDVLPVATALAAGGVRLIEVTLNSGNALDLIEKLTIVLGDKLLIGAGTVLDAGSAHAAIDRGAEFIISPIVDRGCIEATRSRGKLSIPGACTPTEIVTAHRWGGEIIKWFPADAGPAAFSGIRAPLDHIPLMPTGGINLNNLPAFLDAGAVAVGVGSSLVNAKTSYRGQALEELSSLAAKFVQLAGAKE